MMPFTIIYVYKYNMKKLIILFATHFFKMECCFKATMESAMLRVN